MCILTELPVGWYINSKEYLYKVILCICNTRNHGQLKCMNIIFICPQNRIIRIVHNNLSVLEMLNYCAMHSTHQSIETFLYLALYWKDPGRPLLYGAVHMCFQNKTWENCTFSQSDVAQMRHLHDTFRHDRTTILYQSYVYWKFLFCDIFCASSR